MKLSPSPSISASSSSTATTTTTSFDANMCTSKSATASCLAGILRRILCSRSLPTHPSDQITETSSMVCDNKHQDVIKSNEKLDAMAAAATTTPPGIVARLMGLESLPDTSSVDMQESVNTISRSRSMNSVEFRSESDQMQGLQHRRIKSTLSFREMPTFLELENEEFFVLSFENGDESKEVGSKKMKCEVGFRELKEKRRTKSKRKEKKVILENKEEDEEIISKMVLGVLNEAELSTRISEDKSVQQEVGHGGKIEEFPKTTLHAKDSIEEPNVALQEANRSSNCIKHKEVSNGAKSRKKKINGSALKDEEPECSSQDSSPVSVLDFDQFLIDPEVPTSAEENTKSGESNSRRRLTPELDNHIHLSQRCDSYLISDDQTSKKNEESCQGSRKKVCHSQDYLNLWGDICRLAEAQVVESNWISKKIWTFEDFEDIGADFGLQILDQLLEELVDQLA